MIIDPPRGISDDNYFDWVAFDEDVLQPLTHARVVIDNVLAEVGDHWCPAWDQCLAFLKVADEIKERLQEISRRVEG